MPMEFPFRWAAALLVSAVMDRAGAADNVAGVVVAVADQAAVGAATAEPSSLRQ